MSELTIDASGTKAWWQHGKLHHEGAPAIEYIDGDKEWWLHGQLHREGAPAIEYANGDKAWFWHGKRHREDGAAIDCISGYKEWWWHGRHFSTAEQWAEVVLKERNQLHDDACIEAFLKQILKKYAAESL